MKKFIHAKEIVSEVNCQSNCINCMSGENLGEKMNWKDSLNRDFDFIIAIFVEESGPKETILPDWTSDVYVMRMSIC